MFYAIYHPYGRHVVNTDGPRADKVYVFHHRRLRDAWVAADEEHRSVTYARDPWLRSLDIREYVDGDDEAWPVVAADRVASTPLLSDYAAELVEYEWDNPDHFRWVATASIRELRQYAKSVRRDAEAVR